jgi:hypothetical protein
MANFSQQTSALKDALEDAQGGTKYFVKGLSKSQKDGLKELTKKLEKADSEVAKHRKAWTSKLDGRRLSPRPSRVQLTNWKRRWRNFRRSSSVWARRWEFRFQHRRTMRPRYGSG